jgi:AraC family transcriptional regulator
MSLSSIKSDGLLERHSLFPGHERHLVWPTSRFALVSVGGFSMTERQTSRSQRDFTAEVGSFTIWPGGHESASLVWSGWAEILDVDINPAILERIGEFELRPIELAPQPGIQDRHLASLVWAMEAEIRSGCPSGRLYGESISLAVATHIAGRFSAARKPMPGPEGGIEWRRLSNVLDFMHANLGRDIGVFELAELAHLSPTHFARVFRFSMGVAPHRYLVRRWIVEAKRLLAKGQLSIVEVALAVGFANQSHFGQAFRQVVGTTPRRYRKDRGSHAVSVT